MGRTQDLGPPPWFSPAWADLDISKNCSLYGSYASWIFDGNEEPPFPVVSDFWHSVPVADDTALDADIVKWHGWVRDHRDDLLNGVAKQLSKAPSCGRDLCSSVDARVPQFWWLAAFGIPAALVTLFYFMAFLNFFQQRKPLQLSEKGPEVTTRGRKRRFPQAFSRTSDLLFCTAAVLNLAVGASTVLSVTTSPRWDSDWLIFVSTMSFFLLASTLPLVVPAASRGWLKGSVYAVLFVLSTAAWAISFSQAEQTFMEEAAQTREICPYLLPHLEAIQAAVFTVAGMVWMPPLFGICLLVVLCFYRCGSGAMWQATWVKVISKLASAFYGTVNLISLWGTWIMLLIYTRRIPEGKQDAWGLEQVLASAVWAPVLVMLVYHIIVPTRRVTGQQHDDILNEKGADHEDEALMNPKY